MSAMASPITSLTIVYSAVYSVAGQHQSSASLVFVRVIHRWPVNSPHKGPVTRKMFPFHDVIMNFSNLTRMIGYQNNILKGHQKICASLMLSPPLFSVHYALRGVIYTDLKCLYYWCRNTGQIYERLNIPTRMPRSSENFQDLVVKCLGE